MLHKIFQASFLVGLACASAIPATSSPITSRAAGSGAVDIITAIAPLSASCAGRGDECRTAAQAAPHLITAMAEYGIYNVNEMAAVISLMAFESVQFQYNENKSPGVPGQGTFNMQSPQFNLDYAMSIPALATQLSAITTSKTLASTDAAAPKVLALVNTDEYAFGSGAWFYSTQCTAAQKTALQAGGQTAWEGYIKNCVGTDPTESGRLALWQAANTAFGITA